jgi:hypothetical protein
MAAFTTIAAGIGLAATAATTTASFVQAGKQREAQRNAERDADEAMQAARKKLEVNFYDKLSIQKEPYELEREALLSQGAQAIQAGVESERGAAATAGRVQMAQQEGQAGIRTAMGQELSNLEKLSAQEDSRLRDVGTQLDLEEVAGAQLAAANAQELGAQATQQGFQGVTSMAGQLASMAPLYEKSAGTRQFGRIEDMAAGQQGLTPEQTQAKIAGLGTVGGTDFSKVGSMNKLQYQDFMNQQKPETLRMLRQQGLDLYGFNPFKTSTYKHIFGK